MLLLLFFLFFTVLCIIAIIFFKKNLQVIISSWPLVVITKTSPLQFLFIFLTFSQKNESSIYVPYKQSFNFAMAKSQRIPLPHYKGCGICSLILVFQKSQLICLLVCLNNTSWRQGQHKDIYRSSVLAKIIFQLDMLKIMVLMTFILVTFTDRQLSVQKTKQDIKTRSIWS